MADKGLRAELTEVEQKHPGWHCFLSDAGKPWACTTKGPARGYTVSGGTPELLGHEIAKAEHEWARAAA